jgi:hypothetical protein
MIKNRLFALIFVGFVLSGIGIEGAAEEHPVQERQEVDHGDCSACLEKFKNNPVLVEELEMEIDATAVKLRECGHTVHRGCMQRHLLAQFELEEPKATCIDCRGQVYRNEVPLLMPGLQPGQMKAIKRNAELARNFPPMLEHFQELVQTNESLEAERDRLTQENSRLEQNNHSLTQRNRDLHTPTAHELRHREQIFNSRFNKVVFCSAGVGACLGIGGFLIAQHMTRPAAAPVAQAPIITPPAVSPEVEFLQAARRKFVKAAVRLAKARGEDAG